MSIYKRKLDNPYSELTTKRFIKLLPSVEVFVFIFVFFLVLYLMPKSMNSDGDLGRHLTIGEYIIESRRIPKQDIFSHTMANTPLYPHEWLSEVLFAIAYHLAELNGVAWLTAFISASTYAMIAGWMRKFKIRTPVRFLGGIVAFLGGLIHILPRPHIFTLFLFTFFFLVLEQFRKSENNKLLIPLPLIMVLWANLHGAFITGLVLVAIYVVGFIMEGKYKQSATLLGLSISLLLATFINPVGPPLVTHSFSYLQENFLVDITNEYQSPNFHNPGIWPFAGLLLISVVIGFRNKLQLGWTPILLMTVWTAFALYSARNIPLYSQIAVLFLSSEIDLWIEETIPRLGKLFSRVDNVGILTQGWIWAFFIVVTLVGLQMYGVRTDFKKAGNQFDPNYFPLDAVNRLETDLPTGRMFNEFLWGGYMLHRIWPSTQVFIDGQTDFYGESLTREYIQVVEAQEGWESVLEKYDIQWIILRPQTPISSWINLSPYWVTIYQDDTSQVWIRQDDSK